MLFGLLVSLIILLTISNPAIGQEDEGTWKDPENYTLYWGDQISIDEYSIKASDFSQSSPTDTETDFVLLSIDDNSSNSWSAVLGVNNSMFPSLKIVKNKFKIEAFEIVTGSNIPTPYAKIAVYISNETTKTTTWINDTLFVSRSIGNEFYIDQRAHVTISVINLKGSSFDNVTIHETLPAGLIPDPDADLDNRFVLDPYEKYNFHYSLRALKPGNYTLPPTEIKLEKLGIVRTVYTNETNIIFNGPYINLTKLAEIASVKTDGSGYILKITTLASNEGDRAAYVSIQDTLPSDATLVEGSTELSQVILPSEEEAVSYRVFLPMSDEVIIPSAIAEFSDSKGYSRTIRSKQIIFSTNTGTGDTSYQETTANYDPDSIDGENSNSSAPDYVASDYPKFGMVYSAKQLYERTIEIINDALSF